MWLSQIPICRVQYTTPNPIVKEPMYAARRRQKSFRGKFQFGKLCIGQQFQLFDNPLRQLPQGYFIGHQVARHKPQLVDKPQPDAEQEGDSLRFCPAFYCSLPSGFYKNRQPILRLPVKAITFQRCYTVTPSEIVFYFMYNNRSILWCCCNCHRREPFQNKTSVFRNVAWSSPIMMPMASPHMWTR